jgi:formiminoglutamase
LGERINYLKTETGWPEALKEQPAKYVILGIPEDFGVLANYGIGGTETAWLSFLTAFLNIQSNDFYSGENTLILGHFDFVDIKFLIENNAYNAEEKISAYRHALKIVDEEVENLLKVIAAAKKIPIIIGGGHNNAYPIIKGVAKGMHKADLIPLSQINCINLDAHADYHVAEGRHSGNGFRYAEEDGYLGKYCMIGLHENYLSQNVLVDIHNNPFLDYISYEEIFIHDRKNFIQAVAHATGVTVDSYTGIEIDLDCVEQTLSSAMTPSGITPLLARKYVTFAAQDSKPAYLHISEGASQLANGNKSSTTGKLISYLVSDFIKEISQD